MPMLSDKDKAYVRKTLGGMKDEVRLTLFSRDGGECKYCGEIEGLLATSPPPTRGSRSRCSR